MKILDSSDVKNKSLEFIRKQFITGLENTFKEFTTLSFDIVLEDTKLDVSKISNSKLNMDHFVRKNGKFRTPSAIAKKLADALYSGIGRGLSTEVYALGSLEKIGAKAIATGDLKKII